MGEGKNIEKESRISKYLRFITYKCSLGASTDVMSKSTTCSTALLHRSGSSAGCFISDPAPAWESSRGWPKYLSPCTHMGNLQDAPGSLLQTNTVTAFAAIWGVIQQMEDLSSVSLKEYFKIDIHIYLCIHMYVLKHTHIDRKS